MVKSTIKDKIKFTNKLIKNKNFDNNLKNLIIKKEIDIFNIKRFSR